MCGVKRRRFISCYLNNIRPVGLWKCLYNHYIACLQGVFQRYHSENIYDQSFTQKLAAKASWHWNYVTVTSCIDVEMCTVHIPICNDNGCGDDTSECGINSGAPGPHHRLTETVATDSDNWQICRQIETVDPARKHKLWTGRHTQLA